MVSVSPFRVSLADVCFCHWPIERDQLTSAVPDWLTIETAAGECWVSAVAATVERVTSFGVSVSGSAELLTVRTYVRGPTDQRGTYVIALFGDDDRVTTSVSRLFRLPTGRGTPRRQHTPDRRRTLDVEDRRAFECRYTTGGDLTAPPPGSLPAFLVDRHRYFTAGPFGSRLVGSIGHEPWQLDRVDAAVVGSPMAITELSIPDEDPLIHHAPSTDISLAPPVPISPSQAGWRFLHL